MAMPASLTVSRVVSNFAVIIQTIPYFQDSAPKARGCKPSSKAWTATEGNVATDKARKWPVKGFITVFSSDLTLQQPITWTSNTFTSMTAFLYYKILQNCMLWKGEKNQIDSSRAVSSKDIKKRNDYYSVTSHVLHLASNTSSAYLFDSSLLFDASL